MHRRSYDISGLAGFFYPSPRSSPVQLIVVLGWTGVLGIIMLIGLFLDQGWVGRIGAGAVLVALVGPVWARALPLVIAGSRR